jgi:hypothetical protein
MGRRERQKLLRRLRRLEQYPWVFSLALPEIVERAVAANFRTKEELLHSGLSFSLTDYPGIGIKSAKIIYRALGLHVPVDIKEESGLALAANEIDLEWIENKFPNRHYIDREALVATCKSSRKNVVIAETIIQTSRKLELYNAARQR